MSADKRDGPPTIAMHRVSLFMDGFSRATIVPFAPVLIGYLMNYNRGELPDVKFSFNVIWRTATLIATYLVGHGIGTGIGKHIGFVKRAYLDANGRNFSRTIATILALHLLSFGSGLEMPFTLFLIRFLMGVLVGLIVEIASRLRSADLDIDEYGENGHLRYGSDPGIAKVWLTGFAISTLTGGLLFHPFRHSSMFAMLTGGGHSWAKILSPIFLIGIIRAGELLLQFCCLRFLDEPGSSTSPSYQPLSKKEDVIMNMPQSVKKRRGTMNKLEDGLGSSPGHWNNNNNSNTGSRGRLGSYTRNRVRLDSNRSNDIFFDCESQLGDLGHNLTFDEFDNIDEDNERAQDAAAISAAHQNSIAQFVGARCVYEDGTPACVQSTLCAANIPRAYETLYKSLAAAKWKETQKWRIERKVWKVLDSPHPWYQHIKEAYSHTLHGFTKNGYPVVYEKPGLMTLKRSFQNGLKVEDMLHHYTYFLEFMSNVLCNKPELRQRLDQQAENKSGSHWRFVVVMDISGISLSVLSTEVIQYLKNAGDINTAHYPNSIGKAMLVNCPFWISGAFSTVKAFLPDNVQYELLSSSNQLENMKNVIDEDQIPREFGGTSEYKLGEHPFEIELNKLVEAGSKEKTDDDDEEECTLPKNTELLKTSLSDNSNVALSNRADSPIDDYAKPLHDIELGDNPSSSGYPTSNDNSLRTSISSVDNRYDHNPHTISIHYIESDGMKQKYQYHSEEYVFILTSVMHGLWCAVIGSLETVLPLWLLSPQKVGGVGYGPPQTGVSLFVTSVVLMWLLRTKFASIVFNIPEKSTLRGYRIGVGAQACLLFLLPSIKALSNNDGMMVMTTTVLLAATITIAMMIGRNSSAALHVIASGSYMEKLSLRCDSRTSLGNGINQIVRFAESGGFTYGLGATGEIMGSLLVTPLIAWSSNEKHSIPLDASFSFYIASCLCGLLYMASLSLNVKVIGENEAAAMRRNNKPSLKRIMELINEILAVSVSDLASLFEESRAAPSALQRQPTAILGGDATEYSSKKI